MIKRFIYNKHIIITYERNIHKRETNEHNFVTWH